MKKSELKSYIKEEILDTLNESPSSEELRMARQAVYRFMKYRQVEAEEAIRDLINALEELQRRGVKGKLSEEIPSKEEVEDLNKELEKTVELSKEAGLKEEFSEFKTYDDIIGGLIIRADAMKKYLSQNEPDLLPLADQLEAIITDLDSKIGDIDYASMNEEDEAPAGDAEIEKKASKQDLIIKNYDKLRKELKSHLKDYQNAKDGAEKEKHLQQMKKISQSAEYIDAKNKYEKLKQVK